MQVTTLVLLFALSPAFVHDIWLSVQTNTADKLQLTITSGEHLPKAATAIAAERIESSGCVAASGPQPLRVLGPTANALRLKSKTASGSCASCRVRLKARWKLQECLSKAFRFS